MKSVQFCLAGGDTRQLYLARQLEGDGHAVTLFALGPDSTTEQISALSSAEAVVLPVPVTREGKTLHTPLSSSPVELEPLFSVLHPHQHLFAGGISPTCRRLAQSYGLDLKDYMAREEVAAANAIPTAEGAAALAMELLPITLHRSRILLTGFGRVGQRTAQVFSALGASLWVAARDPAQLVRARAKGYIPIPLERLSEQEEGWDLVINTVPAPIFPVHLPPLPEGCILLELASSPGCISPLEAARRSLRLVPAPGLPGRAAPATAARTICRAIYTMLEEETQEIGKEGSC